MKRLQIVICACALAALLSGCGGQNGDSGESSQSQQGESAQEGKEPESQESSVPPEEGNVSDGHNYEDGWTAQMEEIKEAVAEKLGEDYWPNMAVLPDQLEKMTGITPQMYEDYFAEMPMISTNVDCLMVIKAVEDQADAVEQALLDYYDKNVNDTLQYPQNVGKIQGARVERLGDYVIFSQLGADTTAVSEEGDQQVIIAHCQEVNELVIETISNMIQH